MKNIIFVCFVLVFATGCQKKIENPMPATHNELKLMTLDPGHFHAALVYKTMYQQLDSTVYVYAPEGPEFEAYKAKIKGYNERAEAPTNWNLQTYLGPDYLETMVAEKKGNIMVVAGKNSKKIDYVLAAVKAGFHVYADKPLVIDEAGFVKLKKAFRIAQENGLMIYDIMTERFEINTILQKELSGVPELFGTLVTGTIDNPAISKESVHHFSKLVSGKPLVRPPWFFDVNEEGDGIVDVTTHLVDLIMWESFPNQIIKDSEVQMLEAKRWPTVLSPSEFKQVTQLDQYPTYLNKDVQDSLLHVYCNGEMNYTLRGIHAKVSVKWNFKAPEGTGDTHYSMMRGSKAELLIKQGPEEAFKPTLYINVTEGTHSKEELLGLINKKVGNQYKGLEVEEIKPGEWRLIIPEKYKIGHEAHFAQVTENFLKYLEQGALPDWEIPNMLTKYHTTTKAYNMAKSSN